MLFRCRHPLLILTSLVLTLGSARGAQQLLPAAEADSALHRQIPLGIQGFTLAPEQRKLYVMATAESVAFEGWRKLEENSTAMVDAARRPVLTYPQRLDFRVTASALEELVGVDMDELSLARDLNWFLLQLRFRLKVFHGLETAQFDPVAVEMLGVPAELDADERIYRASFVLPEVPLEDRVVLEVLRPDGERLCKFHLDF